MDMVELSVIMPVYNTPEQYIRRAVDSVCAQSNSRFELILVDDGSQKEIGDLLDQISAGKSNFHVLHKENGGVSSARNAGLKAASGPYCTFVDADDELKPRFFENALKSIKAYDADVIYGGLEYLGEAYPMTQFGPKPEFFKDKDLNEIKKSLLYNGRAYTVLGCLPARLYKTEIARELLLNENITLFEDYAFNLGYLEKCKSAVVAPEFWYLYYNNDFSAMHKKSGDHSFFKRATPYWDFFAKYAAEANGEIKAAAYLHALSMFTDVVYKEYKLSGLKISEAQSYMKTMTGHPLIKSSLAYIKAGLPTGLRLNKKQRLKYHLIKNGNYALLYLALIWGNKIK